MFTSLKRTWPSIGPLGRKGWDWGPSVSQHLEKINSSWGLRQSFPSRSLFKWKDSVTYQPSGALCGSSRMPIIRKVAASFTACREACSCTTMMSHKHGLRPDPCRKAPAAQKQTFRFGINVYMGAFVVSLIAVCPFSVCFWLNLLLGHRQIFLSLGWWCHEVQLQPCKTHQC